MDELTQAGAIEAPRESDIVERTAGGEGPLTAREAARSLVDTRVTERAGTARRDDDEQQTGEARDGAAPAQESAPGQEPGARAAQPEAGPGETQADDPAAETRPPIEPPRSWTKEDKELFRDLPRDT